MRALASALVKLTAPVIAATITRGIGNLQPDEVRRGARGLGAVNRAELRDVVEGPSSCTTVLVVAHRLSTVRSASRIVVLQERPAAVHGTHDELMRGDEL